ncbi:hypothetical protein M0R45_037621 [Rubus argutus]|uniref:Amino acid transporter transmembrane domain-containing protein n=1 Tax=Rubus argutus TaxID=59490 RepID=A0AAW1VZM4_RUBAR
MKTQQNDDEAGVVTQPLLHDFKSLEGQSSSSSSSIQGASFSGAVFNISNSTIGAGIMSIPATMKVLGIIPGFIAILFVAVLTEVTVEFLLRYTNSGKSETYAGMVGESFGPLGSIAVQICVIITNLGCLIIYLIIIGDVLCGSTQSGGTLHLGILQEWFGIHWWNSRPFALLFVAIFVMLPLVLLRRVDSLRHTSAISILLAVVFVAISSAMAIYALCKGKAHKPRLFPDFGNQVSISDLFTSIPVIVMGFGFHVNVHPIRAELGEPSDMRLAGRNFSTDLRCHLLLYRLLWLPILSQTYGTYFSSWDQPLLVCLSFIFPGALILRDGHGISTTKDKLIAVVVIVLAVVTSSLAISTSLYTSTRSQAKPEKGYLLQIGHRFLNATNLL